MHQGASGTSALLPSAMEQTGTRQPGGEFRVGFEDEEISWC